MEALSRDYLFYRIRRRRLNRSIGHREGIDVRAIPLSLSGGIRLVDARDVREHRLLGCLAYDGVDLVLDVLLAGVHIVEHGCGIALEAVEHVDVLCAEAVAGFAESVDLVEDLLLLGEDGSHDGLALLVRLVDDALRLLVGAVDDGVGGALGGDEGGGNLTLGRGDGEHAVSVAARGLQLAHQVGVLLGQLLDGLLRLLDERVDLGRVVSVACGGGGEGELLDFLYGDGSHDSCVSFLDNTNLP